MSVRRKTVAMSDRHMTKEERAKKLDAEKRATGPKDELLAVPTELLSGEVAEEEYKRIVNNLQKMDLIGNLDRNSLIVYANAYATYVDANAHIKAPGFEPILETKNGENQSPWFQIRSNALKEMNSSSRDLGLDPSSRIKLATVKIDKEQEDIMTEFGI